MGIIGAMPEVNTNVILVKVQTDRSTRGQGKILDNQFYPLGYLPPGIAVSPEYLSTRIFPKEAGLDELENKFYLKFRELRKGEVILGSDYGSEIFLDKNVELHDESGTTFLLRHSDQSAIFSGLNNYEFTDGVWKSSGLIQRNSLNYKDKNGEEDPGSTAEERILSDYRKVVYIKPANQDLSYGTKIYTEYRVEVDELGRRMPPLNDINAIKNTTERDPVVVLGMGNLVGNDSKDLSNYGKLLGVRLFDSAKSTKGSFEFIPLSAAGGIDYPSSLGMAYSLWCPKNNSFMGIDKEGHFYQYVPASSSTNPLGPGRSLSILAQGSKKEMLGASGDGLSWDFTARGGVKWLIGQGNQSNSKRSIDIRTQGPAYFEYGQPSESVLLDVNSGEPKGLKDLSSYGKIERVVGNYREDIEGSRESRVEGSDREFIDGIKEINCTTITINTESQRNEFIKDNYAVTVLKEMSGKFGSRVTTIMNGSDELNVLKGNVKRTIQTVGNFVTETRAGNIEEKILTGDRKFTSKLGNYSVNCGIGDITVKTTTGTITIKTDTGAVQISALSSMNLNCKGPVSISGLTVSLGSSPAKGAVVTGIPGVPSHFDYVTGAPLIGSVTVKASK
jgi:hypothetical protein